MKDIEKLFEEKLKNHKVVPPAQTWNKLQHQLHGRSRKLKVLYWKIAASVVLVIGAVVAISNYPDNQHTQPSIVVSENTRNQQQENTTYKESSNEESKAEKLESIAGEPQMPIAKAEKKSVQQVKKTNLPAATELQKENDTAGMSKPAFLATVPTVKSNPVQSLKTKGQVTANYELTKVTVASLDEEHPSVKIIYKGVKPQEKSNPLEKTFAFLDQLKSSNISISELRQAKDELITKAFSDKGHEEAGR